MNKLLRIAAVLVLASGGLGLGGTAWAMQQLNKQQVSQFLTSKSQLSTPYSMETWRKDGTYSFARRGGRATTGTYTVSNSGQVCWRAGDGATGCFVVYKDAQGYLGQAGNNRWRYR
jgi:hypothetical protein